MNALDGANLRTTIEPNNLSAESLTPPIATGLISNDTIGSAALADNSSGYLQKFILPKTTLDALGLLKPSNQGDSEALISEIFLNTERLADESNSSQASALRAAAATQASILAAFRFRLISLEATNSAARDAIVANDTQLNSIHAEVSKVSGDLESAGAAQEALQRQITALEAIEPQTDEISEITQEARQQLELVNAQIDQLNRTLNSLTNEYSRLVSANVVLAEEIKSRQDAIVSQSTLVNLISAALVRVFALVDGGNQSVQNAQEQVETETGEVLLEEVLPSLQKLFEINLEDAALERIMNDTQLKSHEFKEAVKVSLGLVGGFFESLGVFIQMSDSAELDLISTDQRGSDSQRVQLPV